MLFKVLIHVRDFRLLSPLDKPVEQSRLRRLLARGRPELHKVLQDGQGVVDAGGLLAHVVAEAVEVLDEQGTHLWE